MRKRILAILLVTQGLMVQSAFASNPVVTDNGYQNTSVCSGQYAYLLEGTIVTDLDGDQIQIQSVVSSHPSIINTSNFSGYFQSNSGAPDYTSYGYYYGTVGNVASPTNVDLTYTFSDGANTVQLVITYLVKNSPNPVFLNSNYEVCSSEGSVDVSQWVYPVGGYFQIDGEETFYDGLLHVDGYSYENDINLSYHYTAANGCTVQTSAGVTIHVSPEITLSISDAGSCVTGDGSIDASVYSAQGSNYTFVWNDGNTVDTDRTGMLPGSYHIDVTDEDGCVSEATGSIGLIGVSFGETIVPASCSGDTDGEIQLNITGLNTPLTTYWSSGQTSESVSNLGAGTYTIYVTDVTGCSLSKTFNVPQPDEIYPYMYVTYPTSCSLSDGYIQMSNVYGGNGTYTYSWSNGETTGSIYDLAPGVYTITITDILGCTGVSEFTLNDYGSPYVYLNEIGATPCGAEEGFIDVDTSGIGVPIVFDWSNGDPTIDITHVAAGNYTLHLADMNGCDSYNIFSVPVSAPMMQPLCMISVDSATTTNIVVWEKVDAANVDHYNIYRETVNYNEFVQVGSVPNTMESIFNDVNASPIAQSWRYKISAVDACGVEGPRSTAHKTMHITTIDLGNGDYEAVWNPYYGIEYNSYKLFRFTASTGWQEIAILPSVINNYYDNPQNPVDLDYMVELNIELECVADVTKIQDFNTTRSNKDKGNFILGQGTGDSNNELGEQTVTMSVYPNPVSDQLTVVVSDNGKDKVMYLVTVEGQVIRQIKMNSVTEVIDMSSLSSGLYFLKVEGQNETIPVVKN